MEVEKTHLRHCMLCHVRHGKNDVEATNAICSVCGIDALEVRNCQRWFARSADAMTKKTSNALEDHKKPKVKI